MNDRYSVAQTYTVDKKPFLGTVKYPSIPLENEDIYVYTTIGDRFDTLANQYYNDPTLWWIISIANSTLPQNSYHIPEGTQVRIPQNVAGVISEYRTLNGK